MKEKILYIYGYGSNSHDSFTMKELKKVTDELGYNLISIEYDQEDPDMGLVMLEKYIRDHKIKYVIGHSLGGFFALCINEDVKKIVINPCMKPSVELQKLGDINKDTLSIYESLERWIRNGDDTPWISQLEDVIGLFGDHDELIDYYDYFKEQYPLAYRINSDHRPKYEAYTEDIKKKIKEFFN